MRNLLLATSAMLALSLAFEPASAAPIAPGSIISFSDGATYSSTAVTFLNGGTANIPASTAQGSFAGFASGCIGCATFTNFSFNPFTSPVTVYTATLGALSTSFILKALTTVAVSANFLDLEGTGTLSLTGFDQTPGTFLLSAQGPQGVNVSFSATSLASAVPEPASMALLCAGLIGAALVRRNRA